MRSRNSGPFAVVVPASAPNAYGTIRSLESGGVAVLALDHHPTPLRRSRLCRFQVVPDPDSAAAEFVESLLAIAGKLSGRPVLFATQDLHAFVIQRHRSVLGPAFRFPFMPDEQFLECVDKRFMLRRAVAAGLTVPESHWPASEEELAELLPRLRKFPYIVKPVAKFEREGTRGTRNMAFFTSYGRKALRAATAAELLRAHRDATDRGFTVLIQEEIEGPTRMLSAIDFCADEGRIIGFHTGRKLRQFPADFGTCTLGRSEPVPEIVAPARRFVEQVGFCGIGNMEFKARDGQLHLMEINPRPWMWIQMATAAGMNLPLLAYSRLGGIGPAEAGRPIAAAAATQRPIAWVDFRVDVLHAAARRAGAVTEPVRFLPWLRSILSAQVEARTTWSDPGPALDAIFSAVGRRLGARFAAFAARFNGPRVTVVTPAPPPAVTGHAWIARPPGRKSRVRE